MLAVSETDHRNLSEMIDKYGVAYSFQHTWHPEPEGSMSTSGRYYTTALEADEALASSLKNLGYTEPRWWQYWRWNERKLGASVRGMLK